MVAQTLSAEILKEKYDALIIGSGIGGLACAAMLSREGKRVLVLEKHYVAGGFTHTFKRKGFEWDVGVHYIGEVHRPNAMLRRVFDYISRGKLQWAKMTAVYDKIIMGSREYDMVAGLKNWREQMEKYFPQEGKALDEYIRLVREAAGAAKGFFGEKGLTPLMGTILRPVMSRKFRKLSDRTTLEVMQSLTSNEELMGVLTAQWGDYGLPPSQSSFAIHAMIVNHYFDGGNYPVGGSAAMADTIIPVIEAAGGCVAVKSGVAEILVEGGRAVGVRLEKGQEIRAPFVISDVGVPNTFLRLVPSAVAATLGLTRKAQIIKPSLSHVCLYIGLDQCAADLKLGQTNYWVYPGPNHEDNIRKYLADPLGDLPLAYFSFPSAKDPTWDARYPDKATIEVIGFAPYEWFEKWQDTRWMKRGEDYEALKAKLADRLLLQLLRYFPQIKGHIVHQELSTPLSTKTFCNYERGEIYGLDHTPERFRQTWLRPHTPIKGLFLTGQDIVTDGIGGALMAGVLTASAMLKKNLIKNVLAAPSL